MEKALQMRDRSSGASTLEATEGERSEPQGAARVLAASDPEVPEKAMRRKFSAEYKLRILRLADSCAEPGSLGRLLRKEGLYSSNLSAWRRQRDKGVLEGLQPAKRGRKAGEPNRCCPSSKDFARKTNGWGSVLNKRKSSSKSKKKYLKCWVWSPAKRASRADGNRRHACRHVGTKPACEGLGASRASYYRRRSSGDVPERPGPVRRTPLGLSPRGKAGSP